MTGCDKSRGVAGVSVAGRCSWDWRLSRSETLFFLSWDLLLCCPSCPGWSLHETRHWFQLRCCVWLAAGNSSVIRGSFGMHKKRPKKISILEYIRLHPFLVTTRLFWNNWRSITPPPQFNFPLVFLLIWSRTGREVLQGVWLTETGRGVGGRSACFHWNLTKGIISEHLKFRQK